jgi:hypothetical protein
VALSESDNVIIWKTGARASRRAIPYAEKKAPRKRRPSSYMNQATGEDHFGAHRNPIMPPSEQRHSFFEFDAGADAFNKSFTASLREFNKRFASNYISPANTLRFRHGHSWRNPANGEASPGEMTLHTAELKTSLADIVANDLGLLQRAFDEISQTLQRQFAGMVYSTVSQACDAAGNTVDAHQVGSLPNAFLAMLEKIELSADKYGKVDMPQVHAPPEVAERMVAALKASPPEFHEKIEHVKQQKIADALEREATRKAKFARYGE